MSEEERLLRLKPRLRRLRALYGLNTVRERIRTAQVPRALEMMRDPVLDVLDRLP